MQRVAILGCNSSHHFIRKAGVFHDLMNFIPMRTYFAIAIATHVPV
jgi:hypothetical protein